VADRVDAAVKGDEPSAPHAVGDGVLAEAQLPQLLP